MLGNWWTVRGLGLEKLSESYACQLPIGGRFLRAEMKNRTP